MNFSFADAPAVVEMGLVTLVSPIVTLSNNSAYLRRNATWFDPFHRGDVSTTVFSEPLLATGAFVIKYAPELDAGLLAVDVAISASYPINFGINVRDVTITGPNGYMRSFTVGNIPEPSGALLALTGCLLLRRRATRARGSFHCVVAE